MNRISKVTLWAVAGLAFSTAVFAEAGPEGAKGRGEHGGKPGGPPPVSRLIEGYSKVAAFDVNKDGTLDGAEKAAITAAITAGTFQLPAHRPPPEGAAPDPAKVLERVTRGYTLVAPYDVNHDGTLDATETAALKAAVENGTLQLPGGRPGGPHGPHSPKAPHA